jgi:hypothetical protein
VGDLDVLMGVDVDAVCLLRMRFRIGEAVGEPTSLQVAVIACKLAERRVDVLDFEFFDDETVVLVLRETDGDRRGKCRVCGVETRAEGLQPRDSWGQWRTGTWHLRRWLRRGWGRCRARRWCRTRCRAAR